MSYKERLHPTVSKAEIDVFKELSKRSLTTGMVTQKPIILKATIPDFMWSEKHIVVYLDGEQVHRKKQEKDEEITNMLEVQGWIVIRIPYTAPASQSQIIKFVNEIERVLSETPK